MCAPLGELPERRRHRRVVVARPVHRDNAHVWDLFLVPSLIEGLRVVQGLRVVPAFLYRYSMKISLKKARSPGTTDGGRSD
jgi:hypothetical protein